MKVTFYATLRQVVGGKTAEFDLHSNATVKDLLNEMLRVYPGLERELINEQGELYPHVHLFVNGRDAIYLDQALDTPLTPEDLITVFPAVGGG
jgi:sulfur-carrier protein